MSFYTRVGSDKVIMRTKGGPNKYMLKMEVIMKNYANINLNGRYV
jgi:hypothetical protein